MKNRINKTPGLRKYVAQPARYAARYGNFTLTRRDYEILDLVYRYRYLEARHIRALIPGSDQQITRRLQGLFHNHYLGRYVGRQRIRLELNPGPPRTAYGLERAGAQALDAHRLAGGFGGGERNEPVRWKKAYTHRTEWFLEHRLMISNFRCVLELAIKASPDLELVDWDDSQHVWVSGSVASEPRTSFRVAPDAYFALRDRIGLRHYFLEADRSTEEHTRLLRKYRAYWWYLQSSEYRDSHPLHHRTTVLFVTIGQERMLNMLDLLRAMPKPNRAQHGGKGLFLFGCEMAYSLEEPCSLLKPIWQNVASSLRALR